MAVHFFEGDIVFEIDDAALLKKWISEVVKLHGKQLGKINYLFGSDEYVYEANVRFLNHDTYTDIITFDYVEGNNVSGDILISVDRVRENAETLSLPFERELHRVVIHGVLHLLGFKDKTDADAATMRQKENQALAVLDALSDAKASTVSRGTMDLTV